MIAPHKYLHLDNSLINVSTILIEAFSQKKELYFWEINAIVARNISEQALFVVPYAINFLFLLGKLDYISNTKKFIFMSTKEITLTKSQILEFELKRLKKSIREPFKFNLDKVKQLFEQTEIYFSENLVKSYEQLLAFNKLITEERNQEIQSAINLKTVELNGLEKSTFDLKTCFEELQNNKGEVVLTEPLQAQICELINMFYSPNFSYDFKV